MDREKVERAWIDMMAAYDLSNNRFWQQEIRLEAEKTYEKIKAELIAALTTAPTVPSEAGRYRMSVDVELVNLNDGNGLWVKIGEEELANLPYFTHYGATFTPIKESV